MPSQSGEVSSSTEFENVVILSDEFYQEITEHPIPTDLEAVKVCAAAPAVRDLVMWLTYRCFAAKSDERIPLFGDFGLAAQLGCVEYSRPRRFRAMLEQWLSRFVPHGRGALLPSATMDVISVLPQPLQYSPMWTHNDTEALTH